MDVGDLVTHGTLAGVPIRFSIAYGVDIVSMCSLGTKAPSEWESLGRMVNGRKSMEKVVVRAFAIMYKGYSYIR